MLALTLRQQVAQEAKQRGQGWEAIAEELGDMAVELTDSNHPVKGQSFRMICREVFRAEM